MAKVQFVVLIATLQCVIVSLAILVIHLCYALPYNKIHLKLSTLTIHRPVDPMLNAANKMALHLVNVYLINLAILMKDVDRNV